MPNYGPAWDDVPQSEIDDIHDRSGWSDQEIENAHIEVFTMLADTIEEYSESEREYGFSLYLHSLVIGDLDRDYFFDWAGIDEGDFDWEAWRLAMGYV